MLLYALGMCSVQVMYPGFIPPLPVGQGIVAMLLLGEYAGDITGLFDGQLLDVGKLKATVYINCSRFIKIR